MEGHRRGDAIIAGADARQRFHDARGYGRPAEGGGVALSPVEAAHLLARGDLDAVDGMGFAAFFEAAADEAGGAFGARYLVYADLRGRGFYLADPDDLPGSIHGAEADDVDFLVFERGERPPDGAVAHRVRVVGERGLVPAADLGEVVLAVVDEESEVTYFGTERWSPDGGTDFEPPAAEATLLPERAILWDPPADLYRRGFYGQPLGGRDAADAPALQLSLVEAAHLAREGPLSVTGGADAVVERGRAVEGERFDRRLAAYAALRSRGLVPKTGFKFGADFRTYAAVTSVDELGHSEALVRVIAPDHAFVPRELALDVRLAGGVRKRMVFALTGASGDVTWLSVGRLTP